MPEKDLLMEFTTVGGGETSWTLDDVKQTLDKATLGSAMQAMCDANCFATTKGAAYDAPLSARYVEKIETPIFDNGNDTPDDDYPTV